MRFHFNDRKTAQAAAYLLGLSAGSMNYMKLIKLLYLADREMLLLHGLPITGDRMVSMKHGPVLSRVLNFINEGEELNQSSWFEYVGEPAHYAVGLLKKAPETDELSRFELGLLKKVHETYKKMGHWELVRHLHNILPEWKDPGSSSVNIQPEDILRANARSDEQIQEAQTNAEELWFLRSPVQAA